MSGEPFGGDVGGTFGGVEGTLGERWAALFLIISWGMSGEPSGMSATSLGRVSGEPPGARAKHRSKT